MKYLFTPLLMLFLLPTMQANLIVELSVENQEVQGDDLYFDIYLTRHADSYGDIYLADMDLALNFNAQFFNDPVLSPVENDIDDTGYCFFAPISDTPQAELDCRAEYFSKTATTAINGNLLIINLLGPEPPNATSFDGLIAWVDGAASTHRLGRFKISGINDQMGTAGLVWAETQTGTMNKIYSFQNFAPWEGKPVEIMTTQIPEIGLDSIISSTAEELETAFIIENIYPNPTNGELSISVFIPTISEILFQINDTDGRVIIENKIEINQRGNYLLQEDVSLLPSGKYQITFKHNNQALSTPFIKN